MMKAFPTADFIIDNTKQGMDLRDYFAAKAMQSIILREGRESLVIDEITYTAYQYADAMMKTRIE
jgi:hypothetical protein